MIGARSLREAAARPTARFTPGDVDEALRILRGVKLHTGAKWQYPASADARAGLRPALTAAEREGLLTEVTGLFRDPLRVYELDEVEGRRFLLLGAWESTTGPVVLRGELLAPVRAPLNGTWASLPSAVADLAEGLERLARRMPDSFRHATDSLRSSDDRVLVIGSPGPGWLEAWREDTTAIAEARGFEAVRLENAAPRVAAVKQRARAFHGRAAYVITAHCGGDANADELYREGFGRSFRIDEAATDDQLTMLRMHLDELAVDLPAPPAVQPRFQPQKGVWYHFKKIASGGGNTGDVMKLMDGPCGHNAWARARRPDQARMGITSVIGEEPTSLQHCGSCTGGGFWRAKFR